MLLGTVVRRVRETGWSPHNIDVIVHAETPKLSPFKASIAEVIATDVELPSGAVSVKAKTNEGLGALGHKDAIACTAVCTVRRAEL